MSEDVLAGDAAYRAQTLNAQATAGAHLLRQTFNWAQVERERGRYDLAYHDEYVAAAATRGLRIMAILFAPPGFRSSAPGRRARRGTYPPRRSGDLGTFGAKLVQRYGPDGSLWRERPTVPRLPIRSWQIWNEPNLPVYWPRGPSPRGYVRLLRATARKIKRADPGAEIVTAGMPQSRLGTPLLKYLTGMYRARGKSAFDTLAINPYGHTENDVLNLIRKVRRLMNRFGDSRASIWVTEVGWSDTGPDSPFRAGPDGQAQRIRGLFEQIGRERQALGIRGVVYYAWKDSPPYPPAYKDFWGLHTGLLKLDGTPKPALLAFQQAVATLR